MHKDTHTYHLKYLLHVLACMTMYILFMHSAVSQYEDRVWLMGYYSGPDTTFGTTMMDFNFDPVKIVYIPEQTLNIAGLFAGISNSTGILLYTNGMQIRNKSYEIVPGGDTISFGPFWESWTFDTTMVGLPLTQGALILPIGEGSSEYAIFHSTADFLDEFGVLFVVSRIYQTIIDVEANSGQGSVLTRDSIIVNDTLAWGKLVACRHANGNDWWILAGRRKDNVYYRILFALNGGITIDTITVGNDVPNGVGQAGFALNGDMYFRYEGLFSSDTGAYVNIYDFDRCTGRLSNHRWWTVPSYGICGAAASPNGRYLYVTTALELLQYDLLAEDIEASEMVVAEYDGYVEPGWFGTYFGKMHLAPDGRIYMVPTTGGSMVMHVIDKPNIRGPGCNLLQHDIKLPTWNARTLPNFPDFSLGALPDGYCDSLTESRSMHAFFEYTVDSINPNAVDFTDLSWYDPVSWSWDFGDGQTSTVQHPVHVYDTVGSYQICLVVSNTFNTDTLCIEITLTDTTGPEMTAMFSYEVFDTALNVLFMDQSYMDPESWHWAFGDGTTSEQQHPEHTYDIDGTYTVCLGVSNGFATDTVCQRVVLAGTTAVDLVSATDTPPVVSPNPFSSFLDFTPPTDREVYDISIIDVQGSIVLRVEMSCPCRIMMDLYPPGVYIYQVRLRNGSVITGKLVKI